MHQSKLPPFTEDDVLPAGTFELTLNDLRDFVTAVGHDKPDEWDTNWRLHLIDGLEILVKDLWDIGIENIFIDGSFVGAKPKPSDIDGYFETTGHEAAYSLQGKLSKAHKQNNKNSKTPWGWANDFLVTSKDSSGKTELLMRQRYHIELFPDYPGNRSGILDDNGQDLPYPDAFRSSKDPDGSGHRIQKGIIKLIKCEGYNDQN